MCIKVTKDGYNYICTHVGKFNIVVKNPNHWLTPNKTYFLVKSSSLPDYYLGNDYNFESNESL